MKVKVTPRSSRNEIRVEADLVRVWVTAAPTDGEANKAVIQLIAKRLGIAPSKVQQVSGLASREKAFALEGLNLDKALEILSRTP